MAVDAPLITFEIVTLFPELFDGFLATSLLGKAVASGLVAVHRTNLRDFGRGKHRSVDDTPYGGGPGMILSVEPVAAALETIVQARGPAHRILLSPQGSVFDQHRAQQLAQQPRILFICGRYEGLDERVGLALADEQLSIGDYVLAGGELATAVIIEAIARLIPGVLGCGMSTTEESFADGRLEYPQWTRPESWRGLSVPPVLLSGDHQAVARWRRREAARRTSERRPDLLARVPLTPDERRALDQPESPEQPGSDAKNRPGS